MNGCQPIVARLQCRLWSKNMAGKRKEQGREARIHNEIVVDAYDASERAMGWYYYLEEKLQFPFTATCIAARPISPLRVGDEVDHLSP